MKNLIITIIALLIAVPAMATTFQVGSLVKVIKEPNGVIAVTGKAEDISHLNVLVQHCPDRFRPGCDDDIAIQPFQADLTTKRFQRDLEGIKRGQISFNFTEGMQIRSDRWLLIPDCNVMPVGLIMEISTHLQEIAWSGGTQFTDSAAVTGYVPLVGEVKYDEMCAQKVSAKVPSPGPARTVAKVTNEPCVKDSDGVAVAKDQSAAAANNSAAATNQSAAANNSSQATATSMINTNVSGKKGKAIVYAPNATQITKNATARGGSVDNKFHKVKVKGNLNNISYVGPTFITIHQGTGAGSYDPNTCNKCHNDAVAKDEKMKNLVQKAMSSAISENTKKPLPPRGKK